MVQRVKSRRQVVLPIDGRSDLVTKEIRGGKGQSLAVMQQLGLRVPPAFTVSTSVMRAYCENGRLPNRLQHQLRREMEVLERKTGKKFGDPTNPLLVSVRSGAATSMPGMMDTILNLGMTKSVLEGFAKRNDATFGDMLYNRFVAGWKGAGFDESAQENVWVQLEQAILLVMRSWDNPRARTYRDHHGISHMLGTAVNVQAMVFGNRDDRSGTGVVFSHDVNSGKRGLYGEYLPCAQGEELVSGKRTPHSIEMLRDQSSVVYGELTRAVELLERHEGLMVEVEFTIESGELYFLQHRKAKASPEARITSIVHDVWARRKTHNEALTLADPKELELLTAGKQFEPENWKQALTGSTVIRGKAASSGVAVGRIAHSSEEAVEMASRGERVILVRPDTSPDDLPGMLAADGIITLCGGATCHAAVVARAEGKPAIVGVGDLQEGFTDAMVSMSGSEGCAVLGLIPVREAVLKKEVSLFAKWTKVSFPKPTYKPELASAVAEVEVLLKSVYLLELMAHEAKGSSIFFEVNCLRRDWYVSTADTFLCYLVHAVARELRHIYDQSVYFGDREIIKPLAECGITQDRINDHNKTTFVLDDVDPSRLLALAIAAFKQPWHKSFGGEKWEVIAQTAHDFLKEEMKYEVFVDRVFDLQHNTGSVFGKHFMLRSGPIKYALNQKKDAESVSRLWECWGWSHFDQKIKNLFNQGVKINLWR